MKLSQLRGWENLVIGGADLAELIADIDQEIHKAHIRGWNSKPRDWTDGRIELSAQDRHFADQIDGLLERVKKLEEKQKSPVHWWRVNPKHSFPK